MEKKFTFLLALVIVAFMNRMYAQPPEILHYNFNGTSTLIPNNASSPPLGTTNASIVGTQTLGGTGQCLGALIGDGSTSSHVNTGWVTSLSGSWSISFWTASITPSSTLWYIFGDVNAGGFRCFTNGVAGANNWILRATGMTDILISGGAVMTPQLNTFVYNATTGVTTSYLNAVFNASVTQTPLTITGSGPFKVGQYGTNSGLPASGLMDEFRFYSRALTLTEVQGLLSTAPTATSISVTSCGSYTSSGNNTYSTSGTYTENVVSCGGNVTNTINLTVNPVPTLTVTASTTQLCNGQAAAITTSGTATSYSWDSGATTSSISVSPTTNTTYIVTGSISTCAVTRSISINVNPAPVVSLAASALSVCLGNSLTLTASGAPVYSWSPVTSSNTVLVVYPTSTTVYSVTGTNTFNCSDTKTVSVIVNSFTPGITSPTIICEGYEVTLSGTGGTGWIWNTNAPFSSIQVTPAITTGYTVTATGPNGCLGFNTTTVTVNPNPTITATADRTVMCKGESNSITITGGTSYSVNGTSAVSPYVFTNNVTVPQNYTVTGNNSFGCGDIEVLSITVNACAGLAKINQEINVNLFPNPTTGLITVELGSLNATLNVYNALGEMIKEQSLSLGSSQVDLQNEAKGIYFIHVSQNDKLLQVFKVIKH